MAEFQEPKCRDCKHLNRDLQFEQWDCDHPAARGLTPRLQDLVAPAGCPLRAPGGEALGKRGQLEDMMGYLSDAGLALARARIAAENAEHPEAGEYIERHRVELLRMREAMAEAEGLEV